MAHSIAAATTLPEQEISCSDCRHKPLQHQRAVMEHYHQRDRMIDPSDSGIREILTALAPRTFVFAIPPVSPEVLLATQKRCQQLLATSACICDLSLMHAQNKQSDGLSQNNKKHHSIDVY